MLRGEYMDNVVKEELIRSFGVFALALMTYPLVWSASNKELPAVGVIIVPTLLGLITFFLRIHYRRRKHEA